MFSVRLTPISGDSKPKKKDVPDILGRSTTSLKGGKGFGFSGLYK